MRFLISLVILSFLLPIKKGSAQDTIVLINGKRINATVLEIKENSIKYRIGDIGKKKIHKINPYRVFSVIKSDGSEQVVFKPDTLDENDFTVSQLRMFIKGEQAAQTGYHNNLNKSIAFVLGAAASSLDIYGLVVPALYSSIVGSVSPDINKQRNVDTALVNVTDYREGYLKITHDKKIRNSFIAGMAGFAAGFLAQTITRNNQNQLNTVIIGFGIGFTVQAIIGINHN